MVECKLAGEDTDHGNRIIGWLYKHQLHNRLPFQHNNPSCHPEPGEGLLRSVIKLSDGLL